MMNISCPLVTAPSLKCRLSTYPSTRNDAHRLDGLRRTGKLVVQRDRPLDRSADHDLGRRRFDIGISLATAGQRKNREANAGKQQAAASCEGGGFGQVTGHAAALSMKIAFPLQLRGVEAGAILLPAKSRGEKGRSGPRIVRGRSACRERAQVEDLERTRGRMFPSARWSLSVCGSKIIVWMVSLP